MRCNIYNMRNIRGEGLNKSERYDMRNIKGKGLDHGDLNKLKTHRARIIKTILLSSESRNICIPGPLTHNVPRTRKAGVSQSRGSCDCFSRSSKPAVYLGFFRVAMKWRRTLSSPSKFRKI
jgi:hypothetical protein